MIMNFQITYYDLYRISFGYKHSNDLIKHLYYNIIRYRRMVKHHGKFYNI